MRGETRYSIFEGSKLVIDVGDIFITYEDERADKAEFGYLKNVKKRWQPDEAALLKMSS